MAPARRSLSTALVAGLLLPSFAFASEPPVRFAYPYTGILQQFSVHPSAVYALCKDVTDKSGASFELTQGTLGCAVRTDAACVIVYIDRPASDGARMVTPAEVIRHEIGHCNGWPADHPD